ncbi:MAG: phosphoribosyl-AMP cyclohydrolase [Halobacteriales archaeon]
MQLSDAEAESVLAELDFSDRGLVVAITRDVDDGAVLMTAFMDREAVERTLTTGVVHYWSRSREALWRKGATSGHEQHLRAAHIDCDGDALLLDVEAGPACHTGFRSCFHRRVDDGDVVTEGKPVFDPEAVYD